MRCGQCQTVFSGIEHLTSADTEAWQKLEIGTEEYVSDHNLTGGDGTDSESLFASTAPTNSLLNFKQKSPVLAAGCIVLAFALALQVVWWQRTALLQHAPTLTARINQAGPTIQNLFSRAATQVLLVEGSGLQALDENNLRVDLTLRNQQSLPAQWPRLRVDLLDSQGLLLASKSLRPNDYQLRDKGSASDAPLIHGQQTVEVLAYLNLSELNNQMPESAATGFRIELYDN